MSLLGTKSDGWLPTLKVTLIGNSDEQRSEVKEALGALADPKLELTEMTVPSTGNGNGNGNGKHTGDRREPDALIIMLSDGDEGAFACLQKFASEPVRPSLIALLADHSSVLMRRAIRAGADELLSLPLNARDASRVLIKIAETKRRTERRSGGVVCSVTSMIGGVGVTSVSINLAMALRHTLGLRVALADLDLQRGMLAVALNLQPEHSILALAPRDKPVDSLQVEAALTKHASSGVYLLAAPKHIEDSEAVSDTSVGAILNLMREMFDFVIVDTGNHVAEQAVAAWEHSDHLLYLLDQSIGGARCTWRFIDLFERLHFSAVKPHFVLNRYTAGYPVTPDQLAQTLSRPVYAKLPYDHQAMERVELSGRDLWQVAPTSPLTKSFEELARTLAQAPDEAISSRPGAGTVSRLVSAIISRTRGAADEAR